MAEHRLALLAGALYLGFVRHNQAIHAPEITLVGLALAVVVCERWPVELEFRRSSHSFSLTDVRSRSR